LTHFTVVKRFTLLLATGFGLGLSPVASGTVGTLLGVALVTATWSVSLAGQIGIAVAGVLLTLPICNVAEQHFGVKDDGRIVADEYLTFPLCMVGLPLEPWVLVMAFLSHRVLDIIKPPPARGAQNWAGGLGVAADDWFSSLYSLAANHAMYYVVVRVFFPQ
tara:strand:+ start:165 stop:650 length:486 start_codon:yes stop_codon:yes gene_type:complete